MPVSLRSQVDWLKNGRLLINQAIVGEFAIRFAVAIHIHPSNCVILSCANECHLYYVGVAVKELFCVSSRPPQFAVRVGPTTDTFDLRTSIVLCVDLADRST